MNCIKNKTNKENFHHNEKINNGAIQSESEDEKADQSNNRIGTETKKIMIVENSSFNNKDNEEIIKEKISLNNHLLAGIRGKGRGRGRCSTPLLDIENYRDNVTGIIYHRGEHAYLESRPEQPFFVCTLQDFRLSPRGELAVEVKWYYRLSEVPDNVYNMLTLNRNTENETVSELFKRDAKIKSRELFESNATDIQSVTQLRGLCSIIHYKDFEEAKDFDPHPDLFFCILGYDPETKRLALAKEQITYGPGQSPPSEPDNLNLGGTVRKKEKSTDCDSA